jgi:hypothetical protein
LIAATIALGCAQPTEDPPDSDTIARVIIRRMPSHVDRSGKPGQFSDERH